MQVCYIQVHHLQREQGGVRQLQDQPDRPEGGGRLRQAGEAAPVHDHLQVGFPSSCQLSKSKRFSSKTVPTVACQTEHT